MEAIHEAEGGVASLPLSPFLRSRLVGPPREGGKGGNVGRVRRTEQLGAHLPVFRDWKATKALLRLDGIDIGNRVGWPAQRANGGSIPRLVNSVTESGRLKTNITYDKQRGSVMNPFSKRLTSLT